MKHKLSPRKMNQDIHISNATPDLYYDARNIRILADDGSNSYTVVNEDGNTLKLIVPDILNENGSFKVRQNGVIISTIEYTNGNLTSIPDLTDLVIIGSTNLRDKIVLFTCDDGGNGYTQIWLLTIGNSITYELIYNNQLGYTKNKPLRKAIARYENEDIQKVWFTNNDANLKMLNVADSNSINKDTDIIDITPSVTFSRPSLSSTGEGSLKAGVVSYAYILYSKDGIESKVSPLSRPYYVTNGVNGGELDENMGLSLNMEIDNIPDNFDTIRIFRFFYTSLDQEPTVNGIIEERINSNSFTFTDDGLLDIGVTSTEDVLFSGSDPFTCKDMEVKDNILFPIGVTYNSFDVDFDTRAYRFDSGGTARLEGDSTLDITSGTIDTVPDEHDCINPTNKEEATLDYRVNSSQNPEYMKYIYQSDGSTLGAEGPNIKLEIRNDFVFLDGAQTSTIIDKNNDTKLRAEESSTFKRDEIYRFGIIFFNNKGQRSFPKWICDLRMPNQDTHPMTANNFDDVFKNNLYLTAQVLNLPSEVTGWQIVRCERKPEDKTILAQGFVNSTIRSPWDQSYAGSTNFDEYRIQPDYVTRTWHNNSAGPIEPETFDNNTSLQDEINSDGATGINTYKMNTVILQLHSPEIEFNSNFNFNPSSYLNIVGGIENTENSTYFYRGNDTSSTTQETKNRNNVYFTISANGDDTIVTPNSISANPYVYTIVRKGFTINSTDIVNSNIEGGVVAKESLKELYEYVSSGNNQEFYNWNYINKRTFGGNDQYSSFIGKNLTFSITSDIHDNFNALENAIGSAISKNSTRKFIVVDYKVNLAAQYGGDTYEARSRNKYIACSDIESSNSISTLVKEGDTYIQYYNSLRSQIEQIREGCIVEKILIPLETSINLNTRLDEDNNTEGSLKQVTTEFDDYYDYNTVYSQKTTPRVYSSKPFNFITNNKFDCRVLYSDTKINGELSDSWTRFRPGNFLDLDYRYGSATGIYEYRGNLFVFQPEAICYLVINPTPQVVDDGVRVELGTGEVLNRYEYIDTTAGSINQYGVVKTPIGLFFLDYLNEKINILKGSTQPISDIKGVHSWLANNLTDQIETDNPIIREGISSVYDPKLSEVYFTFLQSESDTLCFNILDNSFKGFYGYQPELWIRNRDNLYAVDSSLTKLYLQGDGDKGEFFDNAPEESYITYMIRTESGDVTNVFDTLLFNSDVFSVNNSFFPPTETKLPFESVTAIRVWNDYQDTGKVDLTYGDNIKRKFREWRVDIPRNSGTRQRMRSQYAWMTLYFDNSNNYKLNLQDVIVNYRPAPTSYI